MLRVEEREGTVMKGYRLRPSVIDEIETLKEEIGNDVFGCSISYNTFLSLIVRLRPAIVHLIKEIENENDTTET